MTQPTLAFEAIDNFRDYGGYAVAGGGRLRMGTLFRSAHHGAATDQDLALLDRLGVSTIFDLRGPPERADAPSRRSPGFNGGVFECQVANGGSPPHLIDALRNASSTEEGRKLYAQTFAIFPFMAPMIEIYRAFFAALVDGDGATVIHCNAGKDRTGIGVALLHTAMGVHPDEIMSDFLLTNTFGRAEERIELNAAKLRQVLGPTFKPEVARAVAMVEPEYLHATFSAVNERPGGMDVYLRDVLGANSQWRAKAEQLLLA